METLIITKTHMKLLSGLSNEEVGTVFKNLGLLMYDSEKEINDEPVATVYDKIKSEQPVEPVIKSEQPVEPVTKMTPQEFDTMFSDITF